MERFIISELQALNVDEYAVISALGYKSIYEFCVTESIFDERQYEYFVQFCICL